MEYFRWVLLVAGLLLIAFIFFSGKRRKSGLEQHIAPPTDEMDPLFADRRHQRNAQPNSQSQSAMAQEPQHAVESDIDIFENADAFQRSDAPLDSVDDFFTPMDEMPDLHIDAPAPPRLLASITEKIEAFSAKLTPKRRERIEASAAKTDEKIPHAGEEKILSLSVVASEGQFLDGAEIYAIFCQRGYHFGDMGIFHSRYSDKTLFSIANMLEPGNFNLDTIETMQTPGITLFLQLPGPIAADVMFEVLVSEARDLARALGAAVLDNRRSTLTNQTVQHLQEEIYQYMHRAKYFSKSKENSLSD